ncbi:hypothetical protein PIB30_042931 [Stylosanthes scabra]|uniref:Uncharacterized protein n=1 Tax=Stylosanthes scabra TaxID=79078 RepID=A0ABU6XDH3_9FABA|nr:hypothetical protein [Stylosanthes scabra]
MGEVADLDVEDSSRIDLSANCVENLVIMSKLAIIDNNIYFEFWSKNCIIRDQVIKEALLQDKANGGIYFFDNLVIPQMSLSLLRNLLYGGAASGFVKMSATCSSVDRIMGEMNVRHVVTEDNRRHWTGLSEFKKQILHPLEFCEGGD